MREIFTRYGNPGNEMILATKLRELNNVVPYTDFLIPVASNYLKLNIMIILYNSDVSNIVITVNVIVDPRGYVILFQSGAHYKLIYYTDNMEQSTIYTQIKELYQQINPTNVLSL